VLKNFSKDILAIFRPKTLLVPKYKLWGNPRVNRIIYFFLIPVAAGGRAKKITVALVHTSVYTLTYTIPPQSPAIHAIHVFFKRE
jgi:hypothetical protein